MRTNTSSLMDGKDYKKRNFVFSDDHIGDTNKMVSSVEWLAEQQSQLFNKVKNGEIQTDEYEYYFKLIIEQAKEMHRQEIIRAGANHCYPTIGIAIQYAEEYYNEIYKSKENEK